MIKNSLQGYVAIFWIILNLFQTAVTVEAALEIDISDQIEIIEITPIESGEGIILSIDPAPDIKVNGSDKNIEITQSDSISVLVNLDPGSHKFVDADWWLVASTPFPPPADWYHYQLPPGWAPTLDISYRGALFDLSPYQVLNISGLPLGKYTLYFGVDLLMNGIVDFDKLYFDTISVTVTEASAAAINNAPVANALIEKTIDDQGGTLTFSDPDNDLDGLKIIIPAGSVPQDEPYVFSFAIKGYSTEAIDLRKETPYLAFDQLRSGDTGIHPFWGTVIQTLDNSEPVTPFIEFGPKGATFDPPLTLRIPYDPDYIDDEDATRNISVLIGEFENGSFSGSKLAHTRLDTDAHEIVASVPHFSTLAAIASSMKSVISSTFDNTAGSLYRLIQRYRTELVAAPAKMTPMAEAIVCSGIKPKVDYNKMPNPIRLLQFLASPQTPAEGQTDQEVINQWIGRGVMTGLETPLEDWLISQPAASVEVEDLFKQCYQRTNGDVMQALLLCHNVLRGWDGLNRRAAGARGGPIQAAMAPLTGGNRRTADEIGDRYHLFGMAAFSLNARLMSKHAGVAGRLAGVVIPDDEETVGLAVAFEECAISKDCLTDEIEYAIDMLGADIGAEFGNYVLGDLSANGTAAEGEDADFIAEHFAIDNNRCIDVTVIGDTSIEVNDFASLQADSNSPNKPVGYEWTFNGEIIQTGPEFFSQFTEPGTYTIGVFATDSLQLRGFTTIEIEVKLPIPEESEDEYVVWYMDNVRCWDAPRVYASLRERFKQEEATCSVPGGGVNCDIKVEKVELKGGFQTLEDAQNWFCPQITKTIFHFWCNSRGARVEAGGTEYTLQIPCDLSNVPSE